MSVQTDVFVVTHTHWDREWYLTKSQFQMMNVDMMNRLLDILDHHPEFASFMLDGQLIALEDYLSVCPEQAGHLRELAQQGRLAVGPWYVLPDEYLASGEAHIRNFMEGMRLAQPYGAMRLGYLPDSFGHPSQIPQIIAGLGMNELIFWRGPGPEVRHAEFDWVGKDGTEILALNMVYGYSNAANLKEDKAVRTRRLDHEIDKMARLSQLNLVLLMNGSDHIAPDARVAAWLEEYAAEHPELTIRHGLLEDYVRKAQERRRQSRLQKVSGELRSGYRAYLLGDTLSTRMPIKQAQRRIEVALENQLEPLFSLLGASGRAAYPADKLRYLWKLALQNLPHDSICGCGIDAVHEEMFGRYRQMEEISGHLFLQAQSALADTVSGGADGEVTVFSGTLARGIRQVCVTLEKVVHPLRYVDYEQDQRLLEFDGDENVSFPTGVVFTGRDGQAIRGVVEGCSWRDTVECNPMTQPTMNRVLVVRCRFEAELPPLGLRRFAYRFTYDAPQAAPDALENRYYKVCAAPDGALDVLCKATGQWYRGLARLADVADVGDEYTFDGLEGDTALTLLPQSVHSRLEVGKLIVEGTLQLPATCSEDRLSRSTVQVDCPVRLEASLGKETPRVEIRLTVENHACDHRLMALFPLGERASRCLCDSTFALEERQIIRSAAQGGYEGWMEKPNNSFFQKNFSDLAGATRGLCVMVRGLPQFDIQECGEGDQLRLTLLRCVGWLSRKDLKSRNGNGGWTIATPGAQEMGKHTFEFALAPHAPCADHALYQAAMDYVAEPIALQTSRCGAGSLEDAPSFCLAEDNRVALSALKHAEDGDGWILRLCNMSGDTFETPLHFPWADQLTATYVTLDERPDCPAPCKDQTVRLTCRPWKIITLRIKGA